MEKLDSGGCRRRLDAAVMEQDQTAAARAGVGLRGFDWLGRYRERTAIRRA